MKLAVLNKKCIIKVLIQFLAVFLLLILLHKYFIHRQTTQTFMKVSERIDSEKYFRPSNMPILNNRDFKSDFSIPNHLKKTPEDLIINYFSILREAANSQGGKNTGCGTIGYQEMPYPFAYNFLSSTYQKKVNYTEYLKSFENILHINLIKLKKINTDDNSMKYFYEIETIEGSDKDVSYFAYYYGYLYISREGKEFKIFDVNLSGENYLCAPYHGWDYIAEAIVDIKYGGWCSLVKERYPTVQNGYVKEIYFKGTDGNDYMIEFFQLTNDKDIEIAQYKKNKKGSWELIQINPEKCLE